MLLHHLPKCWAGKHVLACLTMCPLVSGFLLSFFLCALFSFFLYQTWIPISLDHGYQCVLTEGFNNYQFSTLIKILPDSGGFKKYLFFYWCIFVSMGVYPMCAKLPDEGKGGCSQGSELQAVLSSLMWVQEPMLTYFGGAERTLNS